MPVAATLAAQSYEFETSQVLQDLVRDSLRSLLPTTTIAMWVVTVAVLVLAEQHLPEGVAILVLSLTMAWVSYNLQERFLSLAVGVYLAGVTIAITILAVTLRGMPVLYAYMLVAFVTAALTDAAGTWAMALLDVVLVLMIGYRVHGVRLSELGLPVAFVLLAAFTAWLGSRRLFTALGWTLRMTKEAQKNAAEARERRAEVRSILKSLEEAYVRLERTNQALIFAREAAEKAYRFKAEFVANVSHELRTPLNLIVGFSEMVATAPESYKSTPLPNEYRGDVMAIYRAACHLGDLINDVLDLSQIEAGRLPLNREPADLVEVIHEAAEIVRGLAEAKGLGLTVDLPASIPMLYLDRTRIRQVLLNLLINATRFTDRGHIRVCAVVEGQDVQIRVEDSGRGIAADRISRAFEAFSQLDDDRAREGSGLGLAVSRKFVELHGGAMWIQSELGRGTTVGFSLPIAASGLEPPATVLLQGAPVAHREGRLRVLVLHDDAHALTLLERHVGGYEYVLAEGAERAIEVIRESPPQAVVADARLAGCWPGVVAQCPEVASLPVFTCSLPSLRQQGQALGAFDYLAKPVTRKDLVRALERLPSPPRTVLVVDDDAHIVRLLARLLRAWHPDLRVLESFGGQAGLEAARTQRPDVVLLDLAMPDLDGYQFLEELGRDPGLASIQVIIISVRPMDEELAPNAGEARLTRRPGLSLSEALQMLQAALPIVINNPARA